MLMTIIIIITVDKRVDNHFLLLRFVSLLISVSLFFIFLFSDDIIYYTDSIELLLSWILDSVCNI